MPELFYLQYCILVVPQFMTIKKIIKRTFFAFLLILIVVFIWAVLNVFPAISGYGSKNLCSAIYLQHRNPEDVIREDLGDFPKSLATYSINEKDSSVTGSVWGFAKRKTIYRKGIGCTLINDFTEQQIRTQQFDLPAKPPMNSDTISWPYGDKVIEDTSGVDKPKLDKAVNNIMTETSVDGNPVYTRAVLVIHNGNIVAEKYAAGFDKNTVMLGWSMSKSLTAAMIGILVKQNKLSVEAPAPVASWTGTKKEKITLKNLLQQTSGLDFTEIYTRPSSVTKMLFSKGDMAAYVESLPLKHDPGTVFNYTSGNSNILSKIIRTTVGEKDYAAFPYKELFHKINAYSFLMEPDASGTYIGSSYSYATARDFARFGLLYYNNGVWKGEQVLPAEWVKESIQSSSADQQKHYGYQFWLNGYNSEDKDMLWYPDVPADMFFADGYGGQCVYVIPSKKLVVVRLGVYNINENKFLKEVIAAVKN